MEKTKYLGVLLVTVSTVACGDTQAGTDEPTGSGATGGAPQAGSGGSSAGSSGTAGKGGSSGTTGTGTGGSAGTVVTGGSAGTTPAGGAGSTGVGGTSAGSGGTVAGSAGAAGTAGMSGGSAGQATGGSAGSSGGAASGGMGGTTGMGGASNGGAAGMGKAGGGSGGAGKAGSGGSAGASSSCDAPPALSPLIGWASVSDNTTMTTTGGGSATPMTVDNLTDFGNAVKGTNAAVIYVKGKLAAGKVNVGSNKTISGLCGAEIHGHLELSGSVNVIVSNLTIVGYGAGDCSLDPDYDSGTGCSSGNDAVTVQKNANHIWFDHCDVSDGTDGNLDITNGANYVTISWTKFHYTARTDNDGSDSTGASGHRYSNLIGGTDNPSTYDDANSLNVTWHHNWWADRVVERQPRVRFGKNHLFNNLWASTGDNYCVRAGTHARILVENSVFAGVKDATQFNSTTDQGTANIESTGNDDSTATGKKDTGGGGPAIGTLPYTYTPDAVGGVSAAVQSGAGPK